MNTMRRSLLSTLVAGWLVAGCGNVTASAPATAPQSNAVYAISLTVSSPSALPACTAALAGTTAYVTSPPGLWSCIQGTWVAIPCLTAGAGAVAYSSTMQTLLACVAGKWTVISLPTGPQGSAGDAGPPGTPGALLSVKPEPPGSKCATGGQQIDVGVDLNRNGTLDTGEVQSTSYVCNGAQGPIGPAGPAGMDGASVLVTATTEPAGANCAAGGVRLTLIADANGNGVLETGEASRTSYVCNGAPALVASSSEPVGANCAAGGVKLNFGLDANGSGVLDAGEVTAASYVCNGVTVPGGSASDGGVPDVGLGDGGASDASDGFVVDPSIGVSLVTPAVAPRFGIVAVTIEGSGFVATPRVFLSGPAPSTTPLELTRASQADASHLRAYTIGGLPLGTYDVVVVNPNGGSRTAPAALTIVPDPLPRIDDLSPAVVRVGDTFQIKGANFRAPTVTLTSASGDTFLAVAALWNDSSVVATVSFVASFGAYAVRVTNDDGSTVEAGPLTVTSPALNLQPPSAGPPLVQARREAGAAVLRTELGTFLYAVGGEGSALDSLSSVEVAAIDHFGRLGPWQVDRSELTFRRTAIAGSVVAYDDSLYVTGGSPAGGNPFVHREIARGRALSRLDAPVLAEPTVAPGLGALPSGAWLYRVSGFSAAGETLPSDPVTARSAGLGRVTLNWSPVPGAAAYNVYRTAAADAPTDSEVLLASFIVGTRFTDDGSLEPTAIRPLPPGSLAWSELNSSLLNFPRQGASSFTALDSAGTARLYVVGGSADGFSPVPLSSYEYATFLADGTLGPFLVGVRATQPKVFANAAPATAADGSTSIYIRGGDSSHGISDRDSKIKLLAGGELDVFSAIPLHQSHTQVLSPAGTSGLLSIGGTDGSGPLASILQAELGTGGGLDNENFAGVSLMAPRQGHGGAQVGGFIYIVGGSSDGQNVLATTEVLHY